MAEQLTAQKVGKPPAYLTAGKGGDAPPGRLTRLLAVVHRHWLVYSTTLLANSLPAFLEPTLFLTAIGLGLGAYLSRSPFGDVPLAASMGPGALAMTAMYTASFEMTYGTLVRMIYQKTYDALLATPLSVTDAFLGELLFCGLKGFAFSACVLLVYLAFGLAQGWAHHLAWTAVLAPCVGFVAACLFGALGLRVTSFVENLNNFNFYFSGFLSPLALFSGMVFPVHDLPHGLREVAYALPLYHVTEVNRALVLGSWRPDVGLSAAYLLVVTPLLTWRAIAAIERRLVR